MTAIILHRTDPARNMRRFYRLDVQPIYSGNGALSGNADA
jgi:predicted DNA-binding WGR domain protein